MSIYNVNATKPEAITEIRWSTEAADDNQDFNLVQCTRSNRVTIKEVGIRSIADGDSALCETAEEAESLMKALQKAIDLGWFK